MPDKWLPLSYRGYNRQQLFVLCISPRLILETEYFTRLQQMRTRAIWLCSGNQGFESLGWQGALDLTVNIPVLSNSTQQYRQFGFNHSFWKKREKENCNKKMKIFRREPNFVIFGSLCQTVSIHCVFSSEKIHILGQIYRLMHTPKKIHSYENQTWQVSNICRLKQNNQKKKKLLKKVSHSALRTHI